MPLETEWPLDKLLIELKKHDCQATRPIPDNVKEKTNARAPLALLGIRPSRQSSKTMEVGLQKTSNYPVPRRLTPKSRRSHQSCMTSSISRRN